MSRKSMWRAVSELVSIAGGIERGWGGEGTPTNKPPDPRPAPQGGIVITAIVLERDALRWPPSIPSVRCAE